MGWLSGWKDKTELVNHLKNSSYWSSDVEHVKASMVGNNLWHLLKVKETGEHIITLSKIEFFNKSEGYGYKGISEDMGPCEINCPLGFLNYPSNPTGFAVDWRERVREYHSSKNLAPKPVAGMKVSYCSHQFELIESLGRKGWRVKHLNGGLYNRLTAKQLNAALRNLNAGEQ